MKRHHVRLGRQVSACPYFAIFAPRIPRAAGADWDFERRRFEISLDDQNHSALATIRALTCLNEEKAPELVGAVLRMTIGGNSVVDNVHAGGLVAVSISATARSARRAAWEPMCALDGSPTIRSRERRSEGAGGSSPSAVTRMRPLPSASSSAGISRSLEMGRSSSKRMERPTSTSCSARLAKVYYAAGSGNCWPITCSIGCLRPLERASRDNRHQQVDCEQDKMKHALKYRRPAALK